MSGTTSSLRRMARLPAVTHPPQFFRFALQFAGSFFSAKINTAFLTSDRRSHCVLKDFDALLDSITSKRRRRCSINKHLFPTLPPPPVGCIAKACSSSTLNHSMSSSSSLPLFLSALCLKPPPINLCVCLRCMKPLAVTSSGGNVYGFSILSKSAR